MKIRRLNEELEIQNKEYQYVIHYDIFGASGIIVILCVKN